MEFNYPSKVKRMNTMSDAPKASIKVLLDTMESNFQFSKLILYSLNTLKSHLITESSNIIYDNSLTILNSKIHLTYFR